MATLNVPLTRALSEISRTTLTSLVTASFQENLKLNEGGPVCVAAIKTLTTVVDKSRAITLVELNNEIRFAMKIIQKICASNEYNMIALKAVCHLFSMFVFRSQNRNSKIASKIEKLKRHVVERGNFFAEYALSSRDSIANYCLRFIFDGCTILTHSISNVVIQVLTFAAQQGKRFNVLITETQPTKAGFDTAKRLKNANIPCKVILDSSVAALIGNVDFVLVGAEGVVESGGIINRIGTFQMSIIAKAMNRPFYVVAESFKFSRMYPLTQNDIPWKSKKGSKKKWKKSKMHPKSSDHYPSTIFENLNLNSNNNNNNNDNNNNEREMKKITIIDKRKEKEKENENNEINENDNGNMKEMMAELDEKMDFLTSNSIGDNIKKDESNENDKSLTDDKYLTVENDRIRDYTPPEYITLLFTDLGILTPSAVSDELLKLYQ